MKITIQSFRKHSLSLAVLAAFGLSAGAAMAQERVVSGTGSPVLTQQDVPESKAAAEAKAAAAAEFARRLGLLAREAAEEAQEAARVAARFSAQSAPTQRDEQMAKAAAHSAQQSAIVAQEARNQAIQSANDAGAARSAAEHGAQPVGAATRAMEARNRTEAATRSALDAAARANAAAAGAALATMPPASDTVSGDSPVNFTDLDEDGDGFISRAEAMSNPNLSESFNAADRNNDGRLTPQELQDWNR